MAEEYDREARLAAAKAVTYYDANGVRIEAGRIYWDNNLTAVRITEIAATVYGMPGKNPATFVHDGTYREVAWHSHVNCSDGRHSSSDAGRYGRLVAVWDGLSAEDAVTAGCYTVAQYRDALKLARS